MASAVQGTVYPSVYYVLGKSAGALVTGHYMRGFWVKEQELKPIYWAEWPGEIRRHAADLSKARQLLGFEPGVNLIDGLNNYIKWVRERHG